LTLKHSRAQFFATRTNHILAAFAVFALVFTSASADAKSHSPKKHYANERGHYQGGKGLIA